MDSSVILYGHDSLLLSTREQVLTSAGLSVHTVTDEHELESARGNVLVLCHTLTVEERVNAARYYHARHPGVRILLLGEVDEDFVLDGCELLGAYPGPEQFIYKVRQLASPRLVH